MLIQPVIAVFQAVGAFSKSTSIPRPSGPYGTTMNTLALTDTTRLDPFAPHPENRSVVISLFAPAALADDCTWKLIPAYPKRTAAIFDAEVAFAGVPKGALEKIELQLCVPRSCSSTKDADIKAPVVFFTPGLGLSRLWYSALAQSVASFGFSVVTVDITYDADVVEFPDGRIITAIDSTWDQKQSELDVLVRAQDVSFVLDELSKVSVVESLFSQTSCPQTRPCFSTDAAGIFGHSIGGAAAAMTMYRDSRFVGGVNLDGGLYGPVIKNGLEDPFLLFGHESNGTSPTWIEIWPHLNWKLDIEIVNSTHTTFTDIPLLASLVFGDPLPSFVQAIVGQIPGERARDVVSEYVQALMGMALKCNSSALLQRPNDLYPEIGFKPSPSIH